MTDMFKKGDELIISPEFSEFVSMATDNNYTPVVGSCGKINAVTTFASGQTLFTVEFDNIGDATLKRVTFPATVSQVQKMAKLKKKADTAAGIVKPAAAPKKVEPVKAEPDDGYDPFADSPTDF